ncbi:leucyl aminopeptidase [Aquabacterium sp. CECT 9606]|uniref:leucyl aminopeptidase n=1 Tax=Aquabacterium sp. CECT 9606 TaxID=2845822 RepID=UPI001E3B1EC9|nr:leucyl aminopeptidase [Aquabacterium sp. CECT 9606]CAH0355013.1 Cytosol aminopeptidase [Aquabacterium sp. CECT 9606]
MDYRYTVAQGPALSQINADALLVILTGDHANTGDPVLDGLAEQALKANDWALKGGKVLYVHRPAGVKAPRLVLVAAADASGKAFKAAVGKGVAEIKDRGVAHLAIAVGAGWPLEAGHAQSLVLAVADATYVYRHTKPSAPKTSGLNKVTLLGSGAQTVNLKAGLAQGQAVAEGVTLARECGNRPGNYCTPTYLANEAKRLGKEFKHLKVQVLDRPALQKLGMGSFLSVANGSDEPPKFIILQYEGAAKSQAPVVLVGKGITFDSGGISIKPGAGMDEMKFDMGGAASVLGTFRAVAELKPKVNLVGLIPTCENMPSGTATRPGDVVTSMSGQTIEVLNTDAEGRLILCDALTYAERFKPAVVVDIATLTGACVVALGHVHSGLFSADEALAQALLSAGQQAQDTAWRLPLDDEYGDSLKSNFADMGNVGGREGGAITAAVFLSKFTKAYRWAHLDIAGSAWKSGGAKGGTGRPVGLLTQFVLSQAGEGALKPQASVAAKKTTKAAGKAA